METKNIEERKKKTKTKDDLEWQTLAFFKYY